MEPLRAECAAANPALWFPALPTCVNPWHSGHFAGHHG